MSEAEARAGGDGGLARLAAPRWRCIAAAIATLGLGALGCATSARLGARVRHVDLALAEAETGGAMRCAPRELAIAQSHAAFARLEWKQGDTASAYAHLDIADENVRAARLLSAPGRCGDPDDDAGASP